jgi:enoyl-CoA hydratase
VVSRKARAIRAKGQLVADLLTYVRDGAVSTITMDDGKANVLSPAMLAELNRALDQAAADNAIVLLTGREQRFSAGFDLNVFKQDGAAAEEMLLTGLALSERLLSFPTPVVAACTGHALAMGAFLLLSADVRIGVAGAFKIGANEVAIGMTMPHTALEICRLRLPPTHFTRAVITAEIYAPEQAVAAGFLDHVVPAAELLARAQETAAALAKLDLGAHAATKLRARAGALSAMRSALELDRASMRARS